jgi:hypothetical protein
MPMILAISSLSLHSAGDAAAFSSEAPRVTAPDSRVLVCYRVPDG